MARMRLKAKWSVLLVMVISMAGALVAASAEQRSKDSNPEKADVSKPSAGKMLFEFKALRIDLSEEYADGVKWNYDSLKKSLGEAPEGKFVRDEKSGTMQIESLEIKDFSKFMKYLEQFGKVQVLYSQSASASAERGKNISMQDEQEIPFSTTKFDSSGKPLGTSTNYIRSGLDTSLDIMEVSDRGISIRYKISLSDATKTKEGLIGKQKLSLRGTTVVGDGLTLILGSHRSHSGQDTDYLFLITPRLVE
jgi:hypothetical protein